MVQFVHGSYSLLCHQLAMSCYIWTARKKQKHVLSLIVSELFSGLVKVRSTVDYMDLVVGYAQITD